MDGMDDDMMEIIVLNCIGKQVMVYDKLVQGYMVRSGTVVGATYRHVPEGKNEPEERVLQLAMASGKLITIHPGGTVLRIL